MPCSDQESTSTDEEIHKAIDAILAADRREESCRKRKIEERDTAPERDRRKRKTGIEKSKRFSLRVMEAMRELEREKTKDTETEKKCTCCDVSKNTTACEVVEYIDKNFRTDGDVDTQVRIALKRLTCQGFVENKGPDNGGYRFLGPFAKSEDSCDFSFSTPKFNRKCRRNKAPSKCCSPRGCGCAGRCDCLNDGREKSTSTVEGDTLRRRIERDIANLERMTPDESGNENTTIDLVRADRQIKNRTTASRSKDLPREGKSQLNLSASASPTRKQSSSALEVEDETVGTIDNPARAIAAAISNPEFADPDEDDDEYDNIDIPDEDKDPPDEEENDDEVDDEGADDAEDDDVLKELQENAKNPRKPMNEARDRELRNWLRRCRRECRRQARDKFD